MRAFRRGIPTHKAKSEWPYNAKAVAPTVNIMD